MPEYDHMDGYPDLTSGTATGLNDAPLTQEERAAWRRELEDLQARRIRPGFALPGEDSMLAAPHMQDKLAVRCVLHPTYKGKRQPRAECEACDWVYDHIGDKAAAPVGHRAR